MFNQFKRLIIGQPIKTELKDEKISKFKGLAIASDAYLSATVQTDTDYIIRWWTVRLWYIFTVGAVLILAALIMSYRRLLVYPGRAYAFQQFR